MLSFSQGEVSEWLEVREIRVLRVTEEARGMQRACITKALNNKTFLFYLEDNKEPSRTLCRNNRNNQMSLVIVI